MTFAHPTAAVTTSHRRQCPIDGPMAILFDSRTAADAVSGFRRTAGPVDHGGHTSRPSPDGCPDGMGNGSGEQWKPLRVHELGMYCVYAPFGCQDRRGRPAPSGGFAGRGSAPARRSPASPTTAAGCSAGCRQRRQACLRPRENGRDERWRRLPHLERPGVRHPRQRRTRAAASGWPIRAELGYELWRPVVADVVATER